MKAILIASSAMAVAAPVYAKDCWKGSPEVLTPVNWSITLVDEPPIKGMDISVTLKNNGEKSVRMVDATYRFEDALGRTISTFTVNPDLKIQAGSNAETATGYMGREMDRVPNMSRDDIRVIVCTSATVYEDGTKEEFK